MAKLLISIIIFENFNNVIFILIFNNIMRIKRFKLITLIPIRL